MDLSVYNYELTIILQSLIMVVLIDLVNRNIVAKVIKDFIKLGKDIIRNKQVEELAKKENSIFEKILK